MQAYYAWMNFYPVKFILKISIFYSIKTISGPCFSVNMKQSQVRYKIYCRIWQYILKVIPQFNFGRAIAIMVVR